jgi:MYXO-CTERM domain-containing protein
MDPGGCGCAAVDPLWGALGFLVLLARRRVTRR